MDDHRIQLAFASTDADYVRRVVEYVRDTPLADRWQLTAFTNSAALRHYLRSGFPIDMVAADAAMRAELEAVGEWPTVAVAALCEGPGEALRPEAKAMKRLQPLPQLFHALHALYAEQAIGWRQGDLVQGAYTAAVYSAAGGSGKTTLAVHLAHQAAASGCRTFYLNLETWNASDVWLGGGSEASGGTDGYAQLLYLLQSAPEQAASRLPGLCRTDPVLGCDYLEPLRNPDDRMSLRPATAVQLIDIAARSGLYDLVIADLDEGADELHMAVFERCSHLFYVEEGTPPSLRKTARFQAYCRDRWGEPFKRAEQKMLTVRRAAWAGSPGSASVPNQAGSAGRQGANKLQALPELPFIEAWRARDGGKLLPSSRLRSAAGRLLESAGISAKERSLC